MCSLASVTSMCAICVLYACMHAVCVLYVCCMCAACMLYACCMCTVCVLYVGVLHVLCVLGMWVSCMCAVCVLYACCMHATSRFRDYMPQTLPPPHRILQGPGSRPPPTAPRRVAEITTGRSEK